MMNINKHQSGVYSIEFVLVAGFFFLLLFSIMEVGKIMYYFNAANDATRRAARVAAVCDKNSAAIKATVTDKLPFITADNVSVVYTPDACTVANCRLITVGLTNAVYTTSIAPISVTLPAFSTTIPRESMLSALNEDCS
jgi:Flp pilus assembly protein TadG